ncbi:carbon-nitrogen hydrolase family protein [Oscillochloris sp. ZM17-4]|uniref:carbon-nitrogen hydrolase family protein n=1 Tax=Oscillochloris sp. ZM17-4 TaxID=2866714 RepID=UPI001C72F7FA|nr:carbon-nitrogen hydrolase family protein [Oscillochloris sp. ZM17-4]MBX0329940.1 carbon-nitrogen hydrolase family protein [Oscillochloris sp. ZM17-4]
MNRNQQRLLWLATAAGLGLFIGGRWNIPLAAWLAPVFVIRFYRTSERPWRDFGLMWIVAALPTIISWRGATFMAQIHPAAEAAFFLAITPLGLTPYVIDRAYARRFGSPLWLTLVFPVAATAVDFLSSSGSPFGSFGAGAYAQRDALPIMQLAALSGLWGITFVIGWSASLANHLWEHGFRPGRPALAAACAIALVPGIGLARVLLAPEAAQAAQIAGFSLPEGELAAMMAQLQAGDEAGFRQAADRLHAKELAQIRALALGGAQIVVLQEGAGLGYADQVAQLLADAAAVARAEQIYLVLPTVAFGAAQAENVVRIIDPSGAVVLEHVKYGGNQFEGSLKGDGVLRVVDTPYGRLSAVICWDADFPEIIRQAGQQRVDLLFVPANDWPAVKDIHAGMATFRAVENGMAIYRQTGQGVSLVADGYGRTIARVDLFAEGGTSDFAATQSTATPIGAVPTLYPQIGDLVGSLMQLGALGLLAGLVLMRVQRRAARDVAALS